MISISEFIDKFIQEILFLKISKYINKIIVIKNKLKLTLKFNLNISFDAILDT